jgi:3D (Asp-Asp-Asp) domain-containing protein
MRYPSLALPFATALLLAGCAERSLPKWEPPLAKTEFQRVRTTAYFDGESDHRRYTNHNALGTVLQTGALNSAAADWARWPEGTVFRLLPAGQTYIIDDYGWDLAGRNTIDLYMPTREQMDCWGLRRVDIQILHWGDPRASYATLLPRSGHAHVARMLKELRPELDSPTPEIISTAPTVPLPAAPMPAAAPLVTPSSPLAPAAPSVRLEPFEPRS